MKEDDHDHDDNGCDDHDVVTVDDDDNGENDG